MMASAQTKDRVAKLRNPDPADLRHAATVPGLVWLPVLASTGPLIADAIEIADESSRDYINCTCVCIEGQAEERWYDTWAVSAEDKEPMRQAVRYLEARALITRHEQRPHLVRFVRERAA